MLVELVGIDDIMPDGIEPACGGADGTEECVAKPDDEDGVLLPHGLTCLHAVAVMAPYPFAYGELEYAGDEGGEGYGAYMP